MHVNRIHEKHKRSHSLENGSVICWGLAFIQVGRGPSDGLSGRAQARNKRFQRFKREV